MKKLRQKPTRRTVIKSVAAVGAAIGFVRRRLERMDPVDADAAAIDPDMAGRAIARDRAAAVNGNSR